VISSREIQGLITTHPLISNQGILDSDSQSMTDMKIARNIRRGKANAESLRVGSLVVGVEEFTISTKDYFSSHQAFQYCSTAAGL
jgi:hypothetical protein